MTNRKSTRTQGTVCLQQNLARSNLAWDIALCNHRQKNRRHRIEYQKHEHNNDHTDGQNKEKKTPESSVSGRLCNCVYVCLNCQEGSSLYILAGVRRFFFFVLANLKGVK